MVKDISALFAESSEAIDWVEETYRKEYSEYFDKVRDLHARMEDSGQPIADDELESILIDVPLYMIEVTEKINDVKLVKELTKLQIKKDRLQVKSSTEGSDAAKKDASDLSVIDREMFVEILTSLIDRVDRQVSFSRELIMSAKKVWDSRKHNVTPVSEGTVSENDLPDYKPKSYIK